MKKAGQNLTADLIAYGTSCALYGARFAPGVQKLSEGKEWQREVKFPFRLTG